MALQGAFWYSAQQFGSMPALRVLYVADRWDGPYRWRCRHAVEQLRLDGVPANTMHLDDPGLLPGVSSYSVVVLFRLPWSARVAALVERVREHGAAIVFDIDDLVFEPDAERLLPFFADLSPVRQAEYLGLFPRLRRTLEVCDAFVGATPVLARHAERLGARAFVHPNLLSDASLRAGRLLTALARRVQRAPTIAYVSGSSTHDQDLAMVSEPLAQVLSERQDARLLLCGFVEVPARLQPFRARILHLPYQDWRAYPFALATCRVSLAPLATLNDFADAKSALKYLEAAAVGVPTIASPSEPFRDAIRDGDTGFLAATHVEWTQRINDALDRDRSPLIGARARDDVRARFAFSARRGQLAALLGGLGGRARGAVPPALPTDPERRTGAATFGRRIALGRQQWALFRSTATTREATRAARQGPASSTPLEAERFDRLIAAVRTHGTAWVRERGPVLCALGTRWQWTPTGDSSASGVDGEYACGGRDPQLLSPPLELWRPEYRYLVVHMAVSTRARRPRAQLFWLVDDASEFSEAESVRWAVEPGGGLRTYVIDLEGTGWARAVAIHRLRFDPLDCPGRVHLAGVALIADLARLESAGDLRVALGLRYLRGRGIECGALQNPLPPLPQVRVLFVDRLTLAQAREHYPELEGQPLARPAIVGDVSALPVRAGVVDFCVANHLLEHAPDPIGVLEELVRVVRPGGRVMLAVPDVGNPLDRGRPVTAFPHLLDDHDPTRDRREAHLEHYREFVDSAHPEMGDGERDALRAHWIAQRYGIHFHTFDEVSYRELLRHVCTQTGAWVEEFVRSPGPELDELIAILRVGGERPEGTRGLADASHTAAPLSQGQELFAAHRSRLQAPNVAAKPILPHYGRWWYPLYLRVAAFTPETARWLGRRIVAARSWRRIRAYRFGGGANAPRPNDGLELVHAGRWTALYRVLHRDPAFELPAGPIPTREVRVIRFEMRCEVEERAHAQLYWGHERDEQFSEAKSVRIPVTDNGGSWREYAVCIDDTGQRALWDAGEQIHRLRFDPLDVPGIVELRTLSLCGRGAVSGASA